MTQLENTPEWEGILADLDAMPLRQISRKYGVRTGAISAAMKRVGVAREPVAIEGPSETPAEATETERTETERTETERRLVRPDPEREARSAAPKAPKVEPLGFDPDALTARPGSKDELILAVRHLLGHVPDREVALAAGVSTRTVASFRSRNGIPAFSSQEVPVRPKKRPSKVARFHDQLGKMPDRVVAERAGVTVNAVRNYRTKHGIPAAGRSDASREVQAAPAPEPQVSAAPERVQGTSAWRVVFREADQEASRIVLGDGLVEAASKVQEALASRGGDVLSVTWLGEVLA